MKKKIDWGVPDWQDETAYAYTKKLTHEQWRWEFMRRRDDYRREWGRATRIPQGVQYIRRTADDRLLLDPRYSARELIAMEEKCDRRVPEAYRKSYIFQLVERPQVKVSLPWVFNLLEDIEPQVKEAKRRALAFQKEKFPERVRNRRKPKSRARYLWQRYLRALDAVEVDARQEEIGAVLVETDKHNSSASNLGGQLLLAARKLRNDFPPY